MPKRSMSGEIGSMGTPEYEKETEAGIESLLQLCQKAGKLVIGSDATLRLLPRNKIELVIYSADLAENTRQKLLIKCTENGVAAHSFGSKDSLGKLFNRRGTGILAVQDRNFAQGIRKKLEARKISKANWEV